MFEPVTVALTSPSPPPDVPSWVIVLIETEMPIATPTPAEPPIPTLAAITASVAVMREESVASTVTPPPIADAALPIVTSLIVAVVMAPTWFTADEPPPATATPPEPPAAIDRAAATDTDVMVALSLAVTCTAPDGALNT